MKSLFAVLLALPCAALAGGGTVVKLDGKATIDRKGAKVIVAESTPIYGGDTLDVADNAAAQVRFEDDSVFVLPGVAKLRVDQFAMPAGGRGGKAIYTLVEGGLRTMTGKVGKGGRDTYEMRTEEATITVAGSAYLAVRCKGPCAKKYRPGLYVKAESGVITVATAAGKTPVKRGQTVYVANNGEPAVYVRVSPFDDPVFGAGFNFSTDFDAEIHPPRIEQEPAASPS